MDTRLTFRDYLGSIKTEGGTQRVSPGAQWLQSRVKRDPNRQIRRVVCQENPLRRIEVPVPQTDTCGREEYSQALG
jgi:hypothetical protein